MTTTRRPWLACLSIVAGVFFAALILQLRPPAMGEQWPKAKNTLEAGPSTVKHLPKEIPPPPAPQQTSSAFYTDSRTETPKLRRRMEQKEEIGSKTPATRAKPLKDRQTPKPQKKAEVEISRTEPPIPADLTPRADTPLQIKLDVPIILPKQSRQTGLLAKISDLSRFKQELLERVTLDTGDVSFQGEEILIRVEADRRAHLKSDISRLIFKFLSDDGESVRIQIESR